MEEGDSRRRRVSEGRIYGKSRIRRMGKRGGEQQREKMGGGGGGGGS